MPDTFVLTAVLHAARVTVQGGSHRPRLAVLTEAPTWCFERTCQCSPVTSPSTEYTTTPGTATTVPSPSDNWRCVVPCHEQYYVHKRASENSGFNTPAAVSPSRFVVATSLLTEMQATVAVGSPSPPSRPLDRSPRPYPQE